MTLVARLFLLMLLAIAAVGCDNSENPLLLNPPLPDSARVRVVSLLGSDGVDVTVAGLPLVTGLAPLQISNVHTYLFIDRVPLYIRHAGILDTLPAQTLTAGSNLTYFAVRSGTHTTLIALQSGKVDTKDLFTRNVGRLVLLNGIDDSSSYYLKEGCQSGDTLLRPINYATSASAETGQSDLSLYLFRDSVPIANAHVQLAKGTVTYLIAAIQGGKPTLFQLDAEQTVAPGPLPLAAPETSNTASVELLNAIGDGSSVSATLDGNIPVANNVAALQISPSQDIQACVDPIGDSLDISSGAGRVQTAIRLSVRSRVLIVVYRNNLTVGAITLNRNTGIADSVHIRVVNASSIALGSSISFGAGAPDPWSRGGRPFPVLNPGDTTAYVGVQAGTYPIVLRNLSTSAPLLSGVQSFANGYYTIFIVDQGGIPTMMLLRDDQSSASLIPLAQPAATVLFFNMMPDALAQFSTSQLHLPDLAYSYVLSTAMPAVTTTINSNVGNTTVDLGSSNYTIGTTGVGSDRTLLAFPGPSGPVLPGQASVRFLNAIKGVGDLHIHVDDITQPTRAVMTYGTPTASQAFDVRKYSFRVTLADDSTEVARTDGVELTAAKNYLMVIGPKDPASSNPLRYATLWIQE